MHRHGTGQGMMPIILQVSLGRDAKRIKGGDNEYAATGSVFNYAGISSQQQLLNCNLFCRGKRLDCCHD
jgi:hypothetical protein